MFTVCVYINWVTTKCLPFVCILTGLQLLFLSILTLSFNIMYVVSLSLKTVEKKFEVLCFKMNALYIPDLVYN